MKKLLPMVVLLAACAQTNPVVLRGEEAKQYDADLAACRVQVAAEAEKIWQDGRSGAEPNPDMLLYGRMRMAPDDFVKRCMETRGYRVIN